MTRQEWMKQLAVFSIRWPRWTSNLSDEQVDMAADLWFLDLEEFPAGQVEAAITALYRDGREFAPNGAQIRLKVIELSRPERDWGKAWELVNEAASRFGAARGLAWLEDTDPIAADAIRRYGWDTFCLDGDTPEGTKRAQFRDIFTEVAAGAERREQYAGIEPAGLEVLEQANGKPTRIGDLIQLDRGELGAGEDAA